MAKSLTVVTVGKDPGTSYQIPTQLWRNVWGLNMVPKVKHFIWKVLHGALATTEALFKRKCSRTPLCRVCNEDVESLEHLLFFCPWVTACWFGCPLNLIFDQRFVGSALRWSELMLGRNGGLSDDGKALLVAMCWEIWKSRCDFVFNGTKVDPQKTVDKAVCLVNDFYQAHKEVERINKRSKEEVVRSSTWKALEFGL